MIDFKRRGEVERVVVTEKFQYAWASSILKFQLYNKIALDTKIGQIAFFATKVASELHQLPNAGQLVVMDFSLDGE